MNVLILEDEPKAAAELRRLILAARPGWRVLRSMATVAEALDWFRSNPAPDLVFSDIRLADGTSFELFDTVEVRCPVIFCTAYDDYAIRAFEANGIDYLLKPVTTARMDRALRKLETLGSALAPPSAPTGNSTLLVHYRNRLLPVRHGDIAFFYYNGALVTLTLADGTTYCATTALDDIEASVDSSLFYRANRQFIVNARHIAAVRHDTARKLVVDMCTATPRAIVVSKAKAAAFLRWFRP